MKRLLLAGIMALALTSLQPPSPQAASWKNGTILQIQGAPEIYYVINGYAAHVPSMTVYNCMGLSKYRQATITSGELKQMPKTAFLIKGGGDRIFRVDGEYRRHVPNLQVFRKKGFNEQEIINVSDNVLRCIPEGPPLR